MQIRLEVEGTMLAATLADNATARDFTSLLPLTLTVQDYASTEKISDLARRLSTAGVPVGTAASVGDIAYYAPWGNLAIFYRAAAYAAGLVTIGRIHGDVSALRRPGSLRVKIARLEG